MSQHVTKWLHEEMPRVYPTGYTTKKTSYTSTWLPLASDLFILRGTNYLVVVNYFSQLPEVTPKHDLNMLAMRCKSVTMGHNTVLRSLQIPFHTCNKQFTLPIKQWAGWTHSKNCKKPYKGLQWPWLVSVGLSCHCSSMVRKVSCRTTNGRPIYTRQSASEYWNTVALLGGVPLSKPRV